MVEIVRVSPNAAAEFFDDHEREALKAFYAFSVIWHEQSYDIAAKHDDRIVGGARIRIAASLAHIERVIVAPDERRNGIGRALLADAADLASYYNCHKLTVEVPLVSPAHAFFAACDYKDAAILRQHTFKLDVAVMRKFLL